MVDVISERELINDIVKSHENSQVVTCS